jgi:putative transposase
MLELTVYKHSIGQNAHHLIFRTKYSLEFFRNPLLSVACEDFLRDSTQKIGVKIYTIKVLPDHVHMLVEIPPILSVTKAIQYIKGCTSKRFFERFTIWKGIVNIGHRKPHLWSRWRFSRSVGSVKANIIDHYIMNSKHNQFAFIGTGQTHLC